MQQVISRAFGIISSKEGRYLFVGGFNTVANYFVSALIYQSLLPHFGFLIVAALVTFVGISISFTTQKILVFRTKGKWWVEYVRSYAVYGSSAVFNTGVMWLLLNRLHLNVWLAQAIVTTIAVVISYFGHTAFTFRERRPGAEPPAGPFRMASAECVLASIVRYCRALVVQCKLIANRALQRLREIPRLNNMSGQTRRLSNAGSYPAVDTIVVEPNSKDEMAQILAGVSNCIPRGAGNSIGDGALNDRLVVSTLGLGRMLSFDEQTGVLYAESGVMLAEIARSVSGSGWFLPTTPGTNQISLGGAIASDVHGKNHHIVGSFSRHVLWIDILTATQGVVRCSENENRELFYATCGGMGLTGIILAAAVTMVQIPSKWIRQIGIKTRSLAETLDACENNSSYTYSVAWIDPHACGNAMGRGYLMCGEFAEGHEVEAQNTRAARHDGQGLQFKIPVYFPVPLLNLSLWTKIINSIYLLKAPGGVSTSIVSADEFFFPLQHMNLKMFGGGHITYQFVLPYGAANEGFTKIFKRIVDSRQGSLISVLKLFGPQPKWHGNLSYPMEGFNLGIDFKVTPDMFTLFRELDAMVIDHGGRHYLTKDVCLSAENFRRAYGKAVEEFLDVKRRWDPQNCFRSLQSMRLELY